MTDKEDNFWNTMSRSEVRKFCRHGLSELGMMFPKNYLRGSNTRPDRIDLVACLVRSVQMDRANRDQSLNMLISVFHPDAKKRKSAKNKFMRD